MLVNKIYKNDKIIIIFIEEKKSQKNNNKGFSI